MGAPPLPDFAAWQAAIMANVGENGLILGCFPRKFDACIVSIYHCAVMLARLPKYIDPLHLADKRGALKGEIPISSLTRLADLLFDDRGSVAVELFFQREGRWATIEGHLESVLVLKCQNCLAALEWPVNSTVKLGIVSSLEQADKLPEAYEPLMLKDDNVLLTDIVEDELLLALPAFPKHPHPCFDASHIAPASAEAAGVQANKAELSGDGQTPARSNPFSILANLKNTGDL